MGRSSHEVVAACGSLVEEFALGTLGDPRLNARRNRVIRCWSAIRIRDFPTRAPRKPRSRLVSVSPQSDACRWKPCRAACGGDPARCAAIGEVLVIHDTTDMVFAGEVTRTGLTSLGPGRQGFWVHAALAVSADGLRAPLGVLSLMPFVRPSRTRATPKNDQARFRRSGEGESRWADGRGGGAHPVRMPRRPPST